MNEVPALPPVLPASVGQSKHCAASRDDRILGNHRRKSTGLVETYRSTEKSLAVFLWAFLLPFA